MPMLIVDDKLFEKETSLLASQVLNSESSTKEPKEGLVKFLPTKGRQFGRIEVPQSLRKIIAEESLLGTPAKVLTHAFDISPSSISAYKVGATSTRTYHKPDPELKKANNDMLNDVTSSARSKLTLALEHITADKIQSAKVGVISQIAKDMSSIVRNLEPSAQNVTNNQVIVYRPKQREEDDFEIITVNE